MPQMESDSQNTPDYALFEAFWSSFGQMVF
jgi:hypothetical protein